MQPHAPGRQLVVELCEESKTNHLDSTLPTEIVALKGSWRRMSFFFFFLKRNATLRLLACVKKTLKTKGKKTVHTEAGLCQDLVERFLITSTNGNLWNSQCLCSYTQICRFFVFCRPAVHIRSVGNNEAKRQIFSAFLNNKREKKICSCCYELSRVRLG